MTVAALLRCCAFQVFHPSSRVSVYTEPLDTWVLRLAGLEREDKGRYDCHLNSDQPSKADKYRYKAGFSCATYTRRPLFMVPMVFKQVRVRTGVAQHFYLF